MGEHTELTAEGWKISRSEQGKIAYRNHLNAAAATADGRLVAEIHPLDGITADTMVRPTTNMEKLAKLPPVFGPNPVGTLTAGNSSPLTDGAATVVLIGESAAAELGRSRQAQSTRWRDSCRPSLAATGARIVTQLTREMERSDSRFGLVSICGAGATAAALILERD